MPFSYWDTTRAERASAMSAVRAMTTQNRVAMTASGFSMSGPHTKGDSVHALDVDDAAGLEGTESAMGRDRAPHLVTHAHLSGLVRRDALHHQGFGADNRVHVAGYGTSTHAVAHPAPAHQHVQDGERGGREETDERIAEQETEPAAQDERRSDEDE